MDSKSVECPSAIQLIVDTYNVQALRIIRESRTNAVFQERLDALAKGKAGPRAHAIKKVRELY